MVDTHCHLDFKDFDRDREEVISRFFNSGGQFIINPGCDLKTSVAAVKLAESHNNIYASVGVHPHDASKLDKNVISELEKLAQSDKVVAIGEIGLDFYRNLSPKDAQMKAFKAQLGLAQKLNLPVIIHCREAYEDTFEIVKCQMSNVKCFSGVAHSFGGTWEQAQKFLKLGLHLSFNGILTYVKNNDQILEVVKNTPLDKILLETDAPFLSPVPHRGKRNEPVYVQFVAAKIAEIKGISLDEVLQQTTQNAKELFALK